MKNEKKSAENKVNAEELAKALRVKSDVKAGMLPVPFPSPFPFPFPPFPRPNCVVCGLA